MKVRKGKKENRKSKRKLGFGGKRGIERNLR
jgi:hypothetical protein